MAASIGGYRCPTCGYDLRGVAGPAPCPECGASEFALGKPKHPADELQHSVFEEPGFSKELAGTPPASAVTYARFLREGRERVGAAASWGIVAGLALLAGPWAVVSAFIGALTGEAALGAGGGAGLLAVAVVAPVTEEVLKIALATMALEKRAYWFVSRWQFPLLGAASGLLFAAIENLLYIHVYVQNPTPGFVRWRWTVCVALHVGCSALAAWGLARAWRRSMDSGTRPDLSLGVPTLVGAMVVHGVYNLVVSVTEFEP